MVISDFIDEDKARKELLKFFNNIPVCPSCGRELSVEKLSKGKFIKCSCGKKQNWKSGTVFQGSRLKASELLLIKYFLDKNMDIRYIAHELCLTLDTVRFWKFKFKENCLWQA